MIRVHLAGLLLVGVALGACGGAGPGDPQILPCDTTSGNICTVAGTGVAGDGDDLIDPRRTMLYSPCDVAFAPDGRLVIVDWNNHRIRMVQPDGRLKIVAGEGELGQGLLGDEVTNRLNHPTDVTFDAQGRMMIAAWHNSRIKTVDLATAQLTDVAGTGARGYGGDGGPARLAVLNLPASLLYDPAGNLYVSDQANQRIRVIDVHGTITTFAGTGMRGFGGDGGPARDALFNLPVGQQGHPAAHIVRDGDGSIFLADTENNRIRRIDPAGVVSTVAGTGVLGNLGDNVMATQAELRRPVDVAIGPEGALYIADTENNCVRKVQGGVISTVVGSCGVCTGRTDDPCRCQATDATCIGDGANARNAHLKRPSGIAFDPQGNLYVADTLNHRVRVVYK